MDVFLTLAERQFIVKYELDGLRAQRDLRVPGLSDKNAFQNRDNICECPPWSLFLSVFTHLFYREMKTSCLSCPIWSHLNAKMIFL